MYPFHTKPSGVTPPPPESPSQIENPTGSVPDGAMSLLESTGTVIQIAFWVLVGTLSLLTYLHARRTFFQPLKTEVFKLQLTALTRISESLHGKGEWELILYFDLNEIVRINSWRFLDQYAFRNLHAVSDLSEELKRLWEQDEKMSTNFCPTWRVDESQQKNLSDDSKPFDRLAGISVSEKHLEAIRKLESLNADPLIPDEIRMAVEHLIRTATQNVKHIGEAFNPLAPGMAKKYPSVEALNSAEIAGMHNRWNDGRDLLEPAAQAVLEKIRAYYQPDLIGFVKRSKNSKS